MACVCGFSVLQRQNVVGLSSPREPCSLGLAQKPIECVVSKDFLPDCVINVKAACVLFVCPSITARLSLSLSRETQNHAKTL